ncbi:MAG TPA: hypothetical protein VGA04_10910 [Streptosporangiaceae bacterium]
MKWAVANRSSDRSLPSGKVIAARYGRHERWGRLVKRTGIASEFADAPDSPDVGRYAARIVPGIAPGL